MEEPGLVCRALTFVHGGGAPILTDVDAVFACGRPTLVIGPTGSGKSTLLHLLGGLLRPGSGEVWADGRPISRWTEPHRDLWRRRVGMVFQHLHLLPDLSVLENVLLPVIPRAAQLSAIIAQADHWLDRLDLTPRRDASLNTLSGGQRQRVALARAMAGAPRYLLLDEPTSFQDDAHTEALMALLIDLAAQGICMVVCSHDIRLRARQDVFAQVYRLNRGRLESAP